MWKNFLEMLSAFFNNFPKIIDFLDRWAAKNKIKNDLSDREKDIEHTEKVTSEIEKVMVDKDVEEINNRFGWTE
jgi:hypothetical protein